MTVPASCEGSMYIEDRWTEEGVLGGAASNIGDSNLGWAGSSLKQEDCLEKAEDQSFLCQTKEHRQTKAKPKCWHFNSYS